MNLLGAMKINLSDEHIERIVSVILRVPGLLLIEYWCQYSASHYIWPASLELSNVITSLVSCFVVTQGLLLLLLPLQDLIYLYMHYLSAALIALAEILSRHYVASEKRTSNLDPDPLFSLTADLVPLPSLSRIQQQIAVIFLHVMISSVICYLMDFNCSFKKGVLAIYTVPVAARLANCPLEHLLVLHNVSTAITILSIIFYSLMSLPSLMTYLKAVYRCTVQAISHYGFWSSIIAQWNGVFILPQLLTFWIILLLTQLYAHWQRHQSGIAPAGEATEWYIVVLFTISENCTSFISLAACCCAVMYLSWAVLNLTKLLAQGFNGLITDRSLERAGSGEGVTMMLLALQTGLIDLQMPQRMGAMSVILFIVVASLVQSMHELVEPVLLALSASNTRSILRHLRVLSLCLFLLIFPIYMTIFLCGLFDVDFWTLVVVSTCALTSVQVLGALTVYSLFLYDSLRRDSSWEELDDVVYIARAVTRVLEFMVALLVVGAGIRESVLLSAEGRPWSWLNGLVLAVHCYYNVYERLQSGWHSFLLRREAARKIHSLPCASDEQLLLRAHDVCAICYMEMKAARVTPCQHLFHASCLKKWLYVQDRCPLCSAQITSQRDDEGQEDDQFDDFIDDATDTTPGSPSTCTATNSSNAEVNASCSHSMLNPPATLASDGSSNVDANSVKHVSSTVSFGSLPVHDM